jgi:hypothetical protein
MERRHVFGIFARALLLLPACLALWYFAAPAFAWIAGTAATPLLNASGATVASMRADREGIHYTMTLREEYTPGRTPRSATVDVEVKSSIYTFGVALFLALALAARESRRWRAIVAGIAVLALLPAWGVAFDALKQLQAGPELQPFLGWAPAAREAVALGYQVGSLLLPTLAPIALWVGASRAAWDGMVRRVMPETAPR